MDRSNRVDFFPDAGGVHGYHDPQLMADADKLLLLVRELANEWQQE